MHNAPWWGRGHKAPTSALPLPRRRSAQKYRLGRVSRTPVHILPIKGPQIKGCEVGRTGPPSLQEELRAYSHQGNPPPHPCHPQSKIWLCSSHRSHFSSLSRKEGVTSRRKTSCGGLHFQAGSALQHLHLQTQWQRSLELQNPEIV